MGAQLPKKYSVGALEIPRFCIIFTILSPSHFLQMRNINTVKVRLQNLHGSVRSIYVYQIQHTTYLC